MVFGGIELFWFYDYNVIYIEVEKKKRGREREKEYLNFLTVVKIIKFL